MTVLRPFRLTPPPAREGDLIRSCLAYLGACQVLAWRVNVAGFLAEESVTQGRRFFRSVPKGMPDIAGVIPPAGRALFVECKTPRVSATPWQAARQAQLARAGALVLEVRSLDELRAGLRTAGIDR